MTYINNWPLSSSFLNNWILLTSVSINNWPPLTSVSYNWQAGWQVLARWYINYIIWYIFKYNFLTLIKGMFHTYNRWGHINIGMMRGKKASIYEGGHRVPFLSWWPLGTHKALQGTNFDSVPQEQGSKELDIVNFEIWH